MKARVVTGALALALPLLLTACGDNGPSTTPPLAQAEPSASPSASPSPSPSPSPPPPPVPASPAPLSPFEDDPVVQGLRAHLKAVADAVNGGSLALPALQDSSTARRKGVLDVLYLGDIGQYYPYPNPVAVLGVQVGSETERTITGCSVERGLVLDKPGGTPIRDLVVKPLAFTMRLEDGRWKLHDAKTTPGVSCEGVPLQMAKP